MSELSWMIPQLGLWLQSLLERDRQYRSWLHAGRPLCFWIAGFFNPQVCCAVALLRRCSPLQPQPPRLHLCVFVCGCVSQGFFTAMRQEVTRQHVARGDGWVFDDIVFTVDVSEFDKPDQIRALPKAGGVAVMGLYLEGASWSRTDRSASHCHASPLLTCQGGLNVLPLFLACVPQVCGGI